jgi:hypothetical protein
LRRGSILPEGGRSAIQYRRLFFGFTNARTALAEDTAVYSICVAFRKVEADRQVSRGCAIFCLLTISIGLPLRAQCLVYLSQVNYAYQNDLKKTTFDYFDGTTQAQGLALMYISEISFSYMSEQEIITSLGYVGNKPC